MLLAIDTTTELGSIALVDLGRAEVVEEVPIHSPEGFAHVLFQNITRLLDRHSLKLADLEGFAATAGPGSFTGVRVGLTAVKGLAQATDRKVVAVSNLQACASFGTRALRAAVLDARRGEIFGAVYDRELRLVQDEVVAPLQEWLAGLPTGDIELVTTGFPLSAATDLPIVEAPRTLAGAAGRIAAQTIASGGGRDPAEIDANYVRRSDAERFWVDRA